MVEKKLAPLYNVFMSNEKYKLSVKIISVCLSSFAFIVSLGCMLGYILIADNNLINIILLPLLIICVFVTAITSVIAFINLGSILGKIAFLLDLAAAVFVVIGFVYLFR